MLGHDKIIETGTGIHLVQPVIKVLVYLVSRNMFVGINKKNRERDWGKKVGGDGMGEDKRRELDVSGCLCAASTLTSRGDTSTAAWRQ